MYDLFNQPPDFSNSRFNGADYVHERDSPRLTGQIEKIYNLMIDGVWRTLPEIENATGAPQASISAQLRHLRKERFTKMIGKHKIFKQHRGEPKYGLYEYQLIKIINYDEKRNINSEAD